MKINKREVKKMENKSFVRLLRFLQVLLILIKRMSSN